MTDVTKLKPKAAAKGTPPAPEITNTNLKSSPREKPVKKGKIEFSVPEHILDEFSKEAGERFGFKKGSKSDLFVAMFDEYMGQKNGYEDSRISC